MLLFRHSHFCGKKLSFSSILIGIDVVVVDKMVALVQIE